MSDLTLAEFIVQRIAEDEEVVSRLAMLEGLRTNGTLTIASEAGYCHVKTSGRRVLAECGAKRRIVELHAVSRRMMPMRGFDQPDHEEPEDSCHVCGWVPTASACDTVRLLAIPYADHPDYREEWKP